MKYSVVSRRSLRSLFPGPISDQRTGCGGPLPVNKLFLTSFYSFSKELCPPLLNGDLPTITRRRQVNKLKARGRAIPNETERGCLVRFIACRRRPSSGDLDPGLPESVYQLLQLEACLLLLPLLQVFRKGQRPLLGVHIPIADAVQPHRPAVGHVQEAVDIVDLV